MGDFDPRARFAAAAVARLATVTPDGSPHVVPVVFAVDPDGRNVVYTAVDAKPKTTRRLRRLANVDAEPRVSLLVDHYADDWTQLWWVRADGDASVHPDGAVADRGLQLLRAKYPQYQSVPVAGPVIAVTVHRWSDWRHTGGR
ncbi:MULTISPECIES: TIGR03668 family PPOX class F420-dependent oxidoreductase [unclassified Mycobacterium]|uniref:TIGR03668 family PPOX class F420-dependent oxidoreductase n=1 Tax=unclassified Mycobacterium TaxID=2642494 RepID=UPI0007FC2C89|nr:MULTISPECIES: TIGR03668 family PPOX class F420-dependent oxidoreductase [unclassified Mycobacterium]OBG74914.1 PPOX class F420-dependent oxidoreductase [Mycobacterium sp. E1214]OBH23147.1 PPOX class F420-dependent oxidoreductase [Mycobacterium sp. E1319]